MAETQSACHIAYLALGSNLGDRQEQLRAALRCLRQIEGVESDPHRDVASLYETEPIGCAPGQPKFLNSVVRIQTTLPARELMVELLAIERKLGRVRRKGLENRLIDLDLLLFDNQIINAPDLQVPHPRMHERRFVLEPLAEIAPDVKHPLLNTTIAEIRQAFAGGRPEQHVVKVSGRAWVQ